MELALWSESHVLFLQRIRAGDQTLNRRLIDTPGYKSGNARPSGRSLEVHLFQIFLMTRDWVPGGMENKAAVHNNFPANIYTIAYINHVISGTGEKSSTLCIHTSFSFDHSQTKNQPISFNYIFTRHIVNQDSAFFYQDEARSTACCH